MENSKQIHLPKILIVCNRPDTAPVWMYILQQQGVTVILETSVEKAISRWDEDSPDLAVIDIDIKYQDPVKIYQDMRMSSTAPILLFLPIHHETRILEAYSAGVDDVIIKPVSPAIFQAKVMAWVRRSLTTDDGEQSQINSNNYRLDPRKRSLIDPEMAEIKLTHLEFRLLHLLMSRPGYEFHADELVESIWGQYGGDHGILKNVVYRLRKKIEPDPGNPVLLQTGQNGYYFQG